MSSGVYCGIGAHERCVKPRCSCICHHGGSNSLLDKQRAEHGDQPSRRPRDPQTCSECGAVCADRQGLAAHVRHNHGSGSKRVACPECGQVVKQSGLGSHRRKRHGIRGKRAKP